MSPPSLLAFFAHPDDEAFSCGGTLAAASDRGIDVTVICATRGEAGASPDALSPEDLAARRSAELASSCELLGAAPPVFLDLPDGQLASHRDALRNAVATHLRERPSDVVVTMGPDGAYGHLDHIACTTALHNALGGAHDGPTVLHTVFPPGLFDELRRRLRRAPIPLAAKPAPPAPPDYRVDIRALRSRKLAAIGAHRSQLPEDDPRSFLLPGLIDALLDEEHFQHAGGPPLDAPFSQLFAAV